jgi:hypothetical protein
MPIPKPRENESRSDYISRAVEFLTKEKYSQKQALAIAYDIWVKEHAS